jgi:transposase
MESIIECLEAAIIKQVPLFDLSPISGKLHGKLKLSPEQLLAVIQGRALALWALTISLRFTPPRMKRGPGGRPPSYVDCSILLMAVVQTVWRKSYEQIIDHVKSNPSLAEALGFSGRSISQGQYWERRMALGVLPFFFFFLGLVAQLIRLGVVTGRELIVDASLLPAWYRADPGATWQKYAKKAAVFGYKVHTVLCRQADLPIFILVTPAHVHDSQVGWLVILMAAVIYGFRVLVVYADSAYFDRRMFKVVHDFLHAHPAINYNLRRVGKRKLATLPFLEQWKRLVIYPRTDIERHFAWVKRYFGLKYFQCFTLLRVTQFVFLTYSATLAVALASERYQRPEFHRSRASVLASL